MRSDRRAGFSLIELMVVVGILGVLASMAISNYMRFQLRARAAEAKTNLAAVRTSEEAYFSEFSTYVPAALQPRALGALNSNRVPWALPTPGFDTLGWSPEGEVYFSYQVLVGPGGGPCPNGCDRFTAEAVADLDADGILGWWGYVEPNSLGAAVPGTFCPATGTFDPQTGLQDQISTVGPCAASMGSAIF